VTIAEGEEVPSPRGVKPSISLHAPCYLKSYHSVAKKYRPTGVWYYVKKQTLTEMVRIQHQHEEPRDLRNGLRDNTTIVNFLVDNIFPLFGEVNSVSYDWYQMQHDAGMVLVLPDPAGYETVEDAHWVHRPVFQQLSKHFYLKYFLAYTSTQYDADKEWIRQEFGVTTFPAVVVQGKHSGTRFVRTGDMSFETLFQFVQDVDDGCLGWRHPRFTFAGLKAMSERDAPKCLAEQEMEFSEKSSDFNQSSKSTGDWGRQNVNSEGED